MNPCAELFIVCQRSADIPTMRGLLPTLSGEVQEWLSKHLPRTQSRAQSHCSKVASTHMVSSIRKKDGSLTIYYLTSLVVRKKELPVCSVFVGDKEFVMAEYRKIKEQQTEAFKQPGANITALERELDPLPDGGGRDAR